MMWNDPEHAYLFEGAHQNDNIGVDPNLISKAIRFDSRDFAAPAIYESEGGKDFVTFNYTMIAMDSTAAIAFNPFGGTSGNERERDHLIFWRDAENIDKRNGITVNKNRRVIGNFGAYNSFNMEFTVMAKRDSCG